jgi:uncharacterized protein (DUF305 family)
MRRVSMVLAVLLLLGGCGSGAPAPAASAADTSGAGSRHASADVAFVQALIPHHRQGIVLASAVARQPAARTLAEAIIVTQQDEVVRMSGWLREWSASAATSLAESSGAPSASLAGSSAASPAAKDPIRALIAHQEEAIKLAQREQANGVNPAALAFARQIVESRAEEIAQLRTYLG